MKPIIFTDLDGTLLDHDGYSWQGASAALAAVRRLAIPLIFTTSKTRAEVEALQKNMGIDQPFIVENGGGLFFPAAFFHLDLAGFEICGPYRLRRFGSAYAVIRAFVQRYGPGFRVRGFGDMEVGEIAERTGLSPAEAALAKQREFSEPFLCSGPLADFRRQAEAHGFAVTTGGRFHHLMGSGQDKGRAVREAAAIWRRTAGAVTTIGLGDSPNDEPLLASVDVAVLLPGPDGSFAAVRAEGLRRAPYPGSRGWGEVVTGLLDGWEATGKVG
ncbi:MAG: HAD-IIB family hydrolase [Thermodesulfobacteriota bacterium]